MLFNSVEFILFFFPTVLLVFYTLSQIEQYRFAIYWLISASLFFYGWWKPVYLILILLSIIFNYSIGIFLNKTLSKKKSKLLLIIGVATNLVALSYFKYTMFFINNYNWLTGSNYEIEKIILPLAISFFTFQQITYLVDTFRGETQEHNFMHYCLFVTFFPQLIAGPIVHHKEMLPQFTNNIFYRFDCKNISIGLTFFFIGLFKKVVMADGLAAYASPIFVASEQGSIITFFEGWSAAIGYTFQLYFDFSGYSDMAIGIAKMFNINLPLNFDSPYKSSNIITFWRRWHMTLSSFLRDYLYFSLGGGKKGKVRRYYNLMVTMLLGGLWHGAGWTFIIWGGLHGIYLVINHAWIELKKTIGYDSIKTNVLGQTIGILITFISVVIAWVIFRSETFEGSINILSGMAGFQGFVLPEQIANFIPGATNFVETVGSMPLLAGGSVMGVFEMSGMFFLSIILITMPATHKMNLYLRLLALTASLYFTIQGVFFSRAISEFLYFQF